MTVTTGKASKARKAMTFAGRMQTGCSSSSFAEFSMSQCQGLHAVWRCYTVLCNSPCCTLLSGLAGVCACVNIPFHLRFMSRMDNLLSQQTLHSTAAAKDERSNGRILSALAMQ